MYGHYPTFGTSDSRDPLPPQQQQQPSRGELVEDASYPNRPGGNVHLEMRRPEHDGEGSSDTSPHVSTFASLHEGYEQRSSSTEGYYPPYNTTSHPPGPSHGMHPNHYPYNYPQPLEYDHFPYRPPSVPIEHDGYSHMPPQQKVEPLHTHTDMAYQPPANDWSPHQPYNHYSHSHSHQHTLSPYTTAGPSTSQERTTSSLTPTPAPPIPTWQAEGYYRDSTIIPHRDDREWVEAGMHNGKERDINAHPREGSVMSSSWWDPPVEYGRDGVEDVDKVVALLRGYLIEIVNAVQPFAITPTNPNPPKPPPTTLHRLRRLTLLIQDSLVSLQPSLSPFLHADFTATPPVKGGMTKAEKEMEVIRKRRDMLIARAAQNREVAMSTGANSAADGVMGAGHGLGGAPSMSRRVRSGSQLSVGQAHGRSNVAFWNMPSNSVGHDSGVGAGYGDTNGSAEPTRYPSTTTSALGKQGQGMTLDHFDASLARFSLDPAKYIAGLGVATGGAATASGPTTSTGNDYAGPPTTTAFGSESPVAPTGKLAGRCHGCGVCVTAEWRRGPDGPRSLCNACGLHYAKLTRRRAQEDAEAAALAGRAFVTPTPYGEGSTGNHPAMGVAVPSGAVGGYDAIASVVR